MRKYWGIFVVTLVFVGIGFASPNNVWTRTYGGSSNDYGYSVEQTSDGGFIIAGETGAYGSGDGDVYLIKTNAAGDTVWTRTYGGGEGYSVEQTSDDGFIITGGAGCIYLIKTNAAGDTVWTRTYGGSSYGWGSSVKQTSDGGFIIAGAAGAYGASNYDVYLIKTNSAGDTVWTRAYGGNDNDYGSSVEQTSDGGFIIAGTTGFYEAGSADIYLIKTNSSGGTVWTRTYGGRTDDWGKSVEQTKDGGFIVAGYTAFYGTGNLGVYLIKTNFVGDTVWTRTYEGSWDYWGNSVEQTKDGGFIIAGARESYGGDSEDVYIIKTNSTGDTVWTRAYGESGYDDGYSVEQTSDGGFIIAGYTDSYGSGGYDVYLIKTDSLGRVGVEENHNIQLQNVKLEIYPNPSLENAIIKYSLPEKTSIQLNLYDVSGSFVKTLDSGTQEKGCYTVSIGNNKFAQGIYFISLETGKFKTTKKLMLLK